MFQEENFSRSRVMLQNSQGGKNTAPPPSPNRVNLGFPEYLQNKTELPLHKHYFQPSKLSEIVPSEPE